MMLLFYSEGNWSSERAGNLSEDTQLTRGRVWTQPQVCVTSVLVSEAAASMWTNGGWTVRAGTASSPRLSPQGE